MVLDVRILKDAFSIEDGQNYQSVILEVGKKRLVEWDDSK